ncbi:MULTISPECIES: hypothetical protein [Nonomuraea]|jgi:hypothetical protein|uniref:Uncharacterized protein n=1 Tax=Nonomuraea salmonea TaxID=46181 RepID=A0ABV5NNK1_9ACTN
MHVALRRAAVAAVVAGGLTLLAAPASHAVVDPALVLGCVSTATDLTTLIDPAAPGLPAELPLTGCLAP